MEHRASAEDYSRILSLIERIKEGRSVPRTGPERIGVLGEGRMSDGNVIFELYPSDAPSPTDQAFKELTEILEPYVQQATADHPRP